MTTLLDHPLATGLAPEWAVAWGEDCHGVFAVLRVGKAEQKLRYIPPGSFLMGSPDSEQGRWDDEGPQHLITFTGGYWLADTPCTQEFWQEVMGNNPSRFQSPRRPVEQVSWDDVQLFLKKLDEGIADGMAQLPTEAQWEYACRAGTRTSTYAGEEEGLRKEIAWFDANSGAKTQNVARKRPNPWGLFDTLGNVWEFCAAVWTSKYADTGEIDLAESVADPFRVYRGGSWFYDVRLARAACRVRAEPGIRRDDLGFRFSLGLGLGRPRSG